MSETVQPNPKKAIRRGWAVLMASVIALLSLFIWARSSYSLEGPLAKGVLYPSAPKLRAAFERRETSIIPDLEPGMAMVLLSPYQTPGNVKRVCPELSMLARVHLDWMLQIDSYSALLIVVWNGDIWSIERLDGVTVLNLAARFDADHPLRAQFSAEGWPILNAP